MVLAGLVTRTGSGSGLEAGREVVISRGLGGDVLLGVMILESQAPFSSHQLSFFLSVFRS